MWTSCLVLELIEGQKDLRIIIGVLLDLHFSYLCRQFLFNFERNAVSHNLSIAVNVVANQAR